MRNWLYILLIATAGTWPVSAHQDPPGDIHPAVSIKDRQFVVSFQRKPTSKEEGMDYQIFSAIYAPDGRVVIPRQKITQDKASPPFPTTSRSYYPPEIQFKDPINTTGSGPGVTDRPGFLLLEPAGKRLHRAVWIEHPNDYRMRTENVLPLEVLAYCPRGSQTSATGDQMAVLWSDSKALHAGEVHLKLSWISNPGFKEGITTDLGDACAYYSGPCTAPLIWASGRWWVGWLQASEPVNDEDSGVRVMLSNYDPVTEKLEHKEISSQSYWISTLSMATMEDRLCLAWHGPAATPPFFSQIFTVFEKLPTPSH